MTDADRPSTLPWPPILFVGAIVLALALDWVLPLPVPFAELTVIDWLGRVMIAGSIGLLIWGALAFCEHRTTIRPDQAASALITSGPFAFSRNPLYLAEAVLLAGVALAFNKLAFLLAVPLFMCAVTRLAILGEERHLEAKFGSAYRDYCAEVRRWA
jgi:protein-S-isoprenylcysteine O-methyltransferase Ste14